MGEEILLAIDVGTQSVRTLAFDLKGQLIDHARVVYPVPYYSPHPGWAEQDPNFYWESLAESCHKLWNGGKVSVESIAAVALTSQRGTVINLDQSGHPLRPAILWLDQRRAKKLPSLGPIWETIFKISGLSGTLYTLQAEAEINWLRENEPKVLEETAHYLFLSGFLSYKLTGEFADSIGCIVGYVPFDYRRQTWPSPNHWKWKAIPVKADVFPQLVPPGSKMGCISAEAAALTGLLKGLPLIAGASDKACEVLGSGCLEPHQGCIGFGTTATIGVNSKHYVEPIPLVPPYPSANPGAYNLEIQTFRGFWMVSWFKEQFALKEQEIAQERGVSTESLLEEMVAEVPPGSLGLLLQPYWSPGLRFPGPEAKGCIIGFGGIHKREHIYRALLEGLVYSMREGRERIEKRSKVQITELTVCGGGSKSDQVMQITADVFNLPVRRPRVIEASGLGAAILAAVGSGLYPDIKTAVRKMTNVGRVFEPNPKSVKIYDELFKKVYSKTYRRLRPLYRVIQAVTGYPEIPGKIG